MSPWHTMYLHHVVFGHQHRLLLLQAVRTTLAPNLGPLDPGGLVGGAWAQGEEAGEQDGFGQLLADGLMGHFAHIHHSVSADHACREEGNPRYELQLPNNFFPRYSEVKDGISLNCFSQ